MLVLSRKFNESVVVGGTDRTEPMLKVTVLALSGSKVILGFEADADVPVHRSEVWERIVTNVPMEPGSGSKPRRMAYGYSAKACATAR
jgi:carbon storage regulator CsrA